MWTYAVHSKVVSHGFDPVEQGRDALVFIWREHPVYPINRLSFPPKERPLNRDDRLAFRLDKS